jgi:hypothetical protein
MSGGEACPQRTDTSGADDAQPDLTFAHCGCHHSYLTSTGIGSVPPFGMRTHPAATTADTITTSTSFLRMSLVKV